jgi:hypothetical protein
MAPLRRLAWKVFRESSVTISPKVLTATTILISVLIVGLTACTDQNEDSDVTSTSESAFQQIGTNGLLIPIESDNMRAAGYDEASMVMTVQFDNGALYEYFGVTGDLWTSFVAAQPHPWSQVGYPRLVQGGIPYKRIG